MLARRDLIEAENLALERDFAVFWQCHCDHAPTRTRADLSVLQRALGAHGIDLATERARRGLGIALGMVLAHELGLQWVRLADEWGVEMALTNGEIHMNAHPLPMIANRADEGREIDLTALFDSVSRLFGGAPSSVTLHDVIAGAPCAWRAEFTCFGAGLDTLEHRLGSLASTLQVAADLSYVMVRGSSFSIQVDSGRGNADDMTMQVSFAGERAMLVVGGARAQELFTDGGRRDLHQHTRQEVERAIDEHVRKFPEAAGDFAPFTDGSGDEPHASAQLHNPRP